MRIKISKKWIKFFFSSLSSSNTSETLPISTTKNITCVGLSPDGNLAIVVDEGKELQRSEFNVASILCVIIRPSLFVWHRWRSAVGQSHHPSRPSSFPLSQACQQHTLLTWWQARTEMSKNSWERNVTPSNDWFCPFRKFVVTKENVALMYHAPGKQREFNAFVLDKSYYGPYDETTCIDWTDDSKWVNVGQFVSLNLPWL